MRQKICDIHELDELYCKEFTIKNTEFETDAFLIYFNGQSYAYENSCPHTGASLNWQKEQFFSLDGLYLQCCLHGALFEPDSGFCVRGPCKGSELKKVDLVVDGIAVYRES